MNEKCQEIRKEVLKDLEDDATADDLIEATFKCTAKHLLDDIQNAGNNMAKLLMKGKIKEAKKLDPKMMYLGQ